MTDHPLPWHVGTNIGRNLYDAKGTLLGQLDTSALARLAVDAVNDRHQVATLEQELRETAGELEMLRANFKALDLDEPMAAQAQLKEATTLLEAERKSHQATRDISEIYRADLNAAELRLSAVRKVAETPWHWAQQVAYERITDALASRAPAQPAAPTEVKCGATAWSRWGRACEKAAGHTGTHDVQPAAPEPSGDRETADNYCRALMAAEAQLAAVRRWLHVNGPYAFCSRRAYQACRSLLTAPSPGAGEETL